MGRCNLNSTFTFSFNLLLLILFSVFFTGSSSEQSMSDNPFQDIGCALINCGQGKCKSSNNSMLGFDCECDPGWKKIQIGPLTFPSCLLPNCTIDFKCENGSTPPPPPSALNFSDPCGLTWCGDGSCVSNGTGHTCQCHQGSANWLNNSSFACFKQCYLGADCNSLGLGLPLSPPPPPPTNSGSSENAPYDMKPTPPPTPAAPNSSSKLRALTMILLAATIQAWI